MPKKRLKQTIHSLCSPLATTAKKKSLVLLFSSMNKQRSLYNPLNIELCSTTAKELAQFTLQLYHYSLKLALYQSTSSQATLHAEIYKPTFKSLAGSTSVSESWKETTIESKENSLANAVKWRNSSSKRVEWAFPHGQPTPSRDFPAEQYRASHNHAI